MAKKASAPTQTSGSGKANKNQTAAERAKAKKSLEGMPSTKRCHSQECKLENPILILDLLPVMVAPKGNMIFFHKSCGPKV